MSTTGADRGNLTADRKSHPKVFETPPIITDFLEWFRIPLASRPTTDQLWRSEKTVWDWAGVEPDAISEWELQKISPECMFALNLPANLMGMFVEGVMSFHRSEEAWLSGMSYVRTTCPESCEGQTRDPKWKVTTVEAASIQCTACGLRGESEELGGCRACGSGVRVRGRCGECNDDVQRRFGCRLCRDPRCRVCGHVIEWDEEVQDDMCELCVGCVGA